MSTSPNLLYLHSHDTGRLIQPYTASVATPNLQRFAENSYLFRNAFCAGPTCSPSRAALLTGQWAHCSGMLGLAHRGFSLTDPSHTLMHHLAAHGYATVLGAVQHIVPPDQCATAGWNIELPRAVNRQSEANEAAKYLLSKPTEPFFLDVGFLDTHLRYSPAPRSHADQLTPPPFLPNVPETRQDFADFCQSAMQFDLHVGRVLGALDESGLADNTIVIITTDHGSPFPNAKCSLTDAGMGVMLMIRCPKASGLSGHTHLDALVSHVDIFPTLLQLTRLPHPSWQLHGKSMVPLLNGSTQEIREEVFSEVTYHAAYEPQRAVRTKRYKHIKRYDGRNRRVLPNCDESRSKTYLLAQGWADWNIVPEYLYDVIQDPCERRNLATDPAYSSVLAEMAGRLNRWMDATADPLQAGQVPAPHGAKVNAVDGQSPDETPVTVS